MTDRSPDDADDHAWLLARERGEPVPPITDTRARHYAQLGTLIANLPAVPAGTVQRAGWERSVLAAIDAEAGQPLRPGGTTPTAATETSRANQPNTATSARRSRVVIAAATIAMAASIAIVVFTPREHGQAAHVGAPVRDVDPGQAERPGAAKHLPEVTRGMHIERGRFRLAHAVQARRSETAAPHELRDGDPVMAGDRMRVTVTTSADAYLYLAFCAGKHLQLYPSRQGVRTRAGDLMVIPDGGGELVVDNHPGSEVLYLILSQNELAMADPQLAELVVSASDPTSATDCGASLDTRLTKPAGVLPPTNVLRGESIPSGTAAIADSDGIAIVRYRFIHVVKQAGTTEQYGE